MEILPIITETIADTFGNPLSATFFLVLLLLCVALCVAIFVESWRDRLIALKILEDDESPASLLRWIIGLVIIVKCIQAFIIQPFIVDGVSMFPTFENKDVLFVEKVSYALGSPHRGDVVVFKLYEGVATYGGKHLVKRLIGLPGDRIVVQNGITTIYNSQHPQGMTLDETYVAHLDLTKSTDVTLNDHQYFVMGDNRDKSYDSRSWGPLDQSQLKGRVLFRVFAWSKDSYLPGNHTFEQ